MQVAEDMEERLCVICLVNDRDTTVLPCRHMCMCHECAQELRKQTSKCPICRNQVESLLHIRMQRRGAETKPGQSIFLCLCPRPLPRDAWGSVNDHGRR